MKRQKLCACLLMFSLCAGLAPSSEAEAAKADVSLSKTSVKLTISKKSGKTTYGTSKIKVKAKKGVKVKKVTYKSGDSKIAKVDKKGKVTAKKAGSTKIKVTVKYKKMKKNLKKTLTFKVTVKKSEADVTATPTPAGNAGGTQTSAPTGNTGVTQTPAPTGNAGVTSTLPNDTDVNPTQEPDDDPKGDDNPSLGEISGSWEELVRDGMIEVEDGVLKSFNWPYYDYKVSIVISDEVTAIGDNAFRGCNKLTSIVIPDSVTTIGHDAFAGCINLTSVKLSNRVTCLNENVFANCRRLKSITIPDSVTCIKMQAFNSCVSLTGITIPDSVTEVEELAFQNCDALERIVVSSDNPVYDSRDNCNAIIEKKTNTLIQGCKDTVIPNTVTGIGKGAFSAYNSLTSIVIPDSVTRIEMYAFYYCMNLTRLEIPASVTSIEIQAFDSVPLIIYDGIATDTECEWGAREWRRSDGTVMYKYDDGYDDEI